MTDSGMTLHDAVQAFLDSMIHANQVPRGTTITKVDWKRTPPFDTLEATVFLSNGDTFYIEGHPPVEGKMQ